MSLRSRVALAAGLAALVTIALSSVGLYFGVRHYLYDQVDAKMSAVGSLPSAARNLRLLEHALESGLPEGAAGIAAGQQQSDLQFVDRRGTVVAHLGATILPVPAAVRRVASATGATTYFNVTADGSTVRVYALGIGNGTAFEVDHSLDDVSVALHGLLIAAAVVSLTGLVLALVLGTLLAFAALRPLRHLSAAVRAVTATGELSHHVAVQGHDELNELATSFNSMLDALDQSLVQQRQLVADASHVLRTPLTTVRTNVEILQRTGEMESGERAELLDQTVAQLAELTRLLNDLMELARGEQEKGSFGWLRSTS